MNQSWWLHINDIFSHDVVYINIKIFRYLILKEVYIIGRHAALNCKTSLSYPDDTVIYRIQILDLMDYISFWMSQHNIIIPILSVLW